MPEIFTGGGAGGGRKTGSLEMPLKVLNADFLWL